MGLAQAILHRPPLLILDEPSVGLDPTQIVEMRHLIQRLAERSTILFSTHILSEVEALCQRVLILINGEIRADARLSELRSSNDAILVLNAPVTRGRRPAEGAAGGAERDADRQRTGAIRRTGSREMSRVTCARRCMRWRATCSGRCGSCGRIGRRWRTYLRSWRREG